MRKYIISTFLSVIISSAAFAQNDIKAREEFTEAQTAFDETNFDKALEHLNSAQQLLGVWSPKIAHLRIVTLDNMCNYSSPENIYTKLQQKEVSQYLKTVINKKDDKFTFIVGVDKKLALLKKIEQDRASEEYKSAEKLLEQKNYTERISILKKAAANGNLLAMYEIASNYEYSNRGQSADPKAAFEGYKDLVKKGFFPAAYSLGIYSSIGY